MTKNLYIITKIENKGKKWNIIAKSLNVLIVK